MTLIDFIKEYPDVASCKAKFKQYREHMGVVCPKCGGETHYWKKDKDSYTEGKSWRNSAMGAYSNQQCKKASSQHIS